MTRMKCPFRPGIAASFNPIIHALRLLVRLHALRKTSFRISLGRVTGRGISFTLGELVSESQRVRLLPVYSKTGNLETKCNDQEGKRHSRVRRAIFYTCRAWLSCVVPILLTIPSFDTLTGRPPKVNPTDLPFPPSLPKFNRIPSTSSPSHNNNKRAHITYPKELWSPKGNPWTGV
jgi:hypothetical protein